MHSPVQRNRHGAAPSPHNTPNHPSINLINREQQRHDLSPSGSVHTMHIYKRQEGEERDVCAAEERVDIVRCDGCAEEDQDNCEERRSCDA
jgi:hypothetical protein